MEICRDCGHKNIGALYCVKCGSDLFARKRPERDGVMNTFTVLLTPFAKRK